MNKTPSHTASFILHARFVSSQHAGVSASSPNTASDKNTWSARVASELYLASFLPLRSRVRRARVRAGHPGGTPGACRPDAGPMACLVPGAGRGAGGVILGQGQEHEGGGLPGAPVDAWLYSEAATQPREGARSLHSARVGLEHRPDAGGQGVWRGALRGAAHTQALCGQGVGRGGADGHELQEEDRGVSAEPQAFGGKVGDAGGGGCRARRTSC